MVSDDHLVRGTRRQKDQMGMGLDGWEEVLKGIRARFDQGLGIPSMEPFFHTMLAGNTYIPSCDELTRRWH